MQNNVVYNSKENVLELTHISKSFPGVKALDDVKVELKRGEILGLVGENGAGKSTLINIISGVLQPDEGEIKVKGKTVRFTGPRQSMREGINVVHQERCLIPTFCVAENILIEQMTARDFSLANKRRLCERAKVFLQTVELDIPPESGIDHLSAGQQQMIEIAKALSSCGDILIFDEPTASISVKEANVLLNMILKLKNQGVSIIYVSHKLEEIFRIADAVMVIRDGKNVEERQLAGSLTREKLIAMMVGREDLAESFALRKREARTPILEAEGVSGKNAPKAKTFILHKGEILGWYGLVGAGRTEFARVLLGIDKKVGGLIKLDGKQIEPRSPSHMLNKNRVACISENRQDEGLFLIHSIERNISASIWDRLRIRAGLLDVRQEKRIAMQYIEKLEIKTSSAEQLVNSLSGGNRQKVSIAKGLAIAPRVLIIDEPTVGIDVKTKIEIHELIAKLADEGISIIVISSDMQEIIAVADRLLVFCDGEICGEIENTKVYEQTSKEIMRAIVSD